MTERLASEGHMICPYCAEEIHDTAIKCRFCGEAINEADRRGYPSFWIQCGREGLNFVALIEDYLTYVCERDLKERIAKDELGVEGGSALKTDNALGNIRTLLPVRDEWGVGDWGVKYAFGMQYTDQAILRRLKETRVSVGTPQHRLLTASIAYAEIILPLYTLIGQQSNEVMIEAKKRELAHAPNRLRALLASLDELEEPGRGQVQVRVKSAIAECETKSA